MEHRVVQERVEPGGGVQQQGYGGTPSVHGGELLPRVEEGGGRFVGGEEEEGRRVDLPA